MVIETKYEIENDLSFVSYINENGLKQDVWVKVLDANGFMIKFKTKEGNIVMIPYSRILKIKQKLVEVKKECKE